jgi:peptidoglycan/LPS O-acetylase OafA/YrhL
VLPVVAKLWLALGLDGGGLIGLTFVVVAMTASACAGVILYKLVERPLLQWLSGKRQASARPARAPGLEQAKLPGSSR